jgi:hypothetical protein
MAAGYADGLASCALHPMSHVLKSCHEHAYDPTYVKILLPEANIAFGRSNFDE